MSSLKICRLTRVTDDKRVGLPSDMRSFSTNRNFVTINVSFLAGDTLWKSFPAASLGKHFFLFFSLCGFNALPYA